MKTILTNLNLLFHLSYIYSKYYTLPKYNLDSLVTTLKSSDFNFGFINNSLNKL